MAFSIADKLLLRQTEWNAHVTSLGQTCLRVKNTVVVNSGGSARSFTSSDTETMDCMFFADTQDAQNIIVYEDATEAIDSRWKFYFRSDADVQLLDWIYIKRSGSSWGTAAANDYDFKLRVDEVLPQNAGVTIVGWVVFAKNIDEGGGASQVGQT